MAQFHTDTHVYFVGQIYIFGEALVDQNVAIHFAPAENIVDSCRRRFRTGVARTPVLVPGIARVDQWDVIGTPKNLMMGWSMVGNAHVTSDLDGGIPALLSDLWMILRQPIAKQPTETMVNIREPFLFNLGLGVIEIIQFDHV